MDILIVYKSTEDMMESRDIINWIDNIQDTAKTLLSEDCKDCLISPLEYMAGDYSKGASWYDLIQDKQEWKKYEMTFAKRKEIIKTGKITLLRTILKNIDEKLHKKIY